MPLYDYRCTACGKVTEVRHGFEERFSGTCPACGGALQRVFNAAPILFKGSGFYVTDSRKKSADAAKSDAGKGDAAKSDAVKSDTSKPAEAAAKPGKPSPDPKPTKPPSSESAA
ncbi:MAG TPA: FmdB family zinc ribbon protein [Candidatus Tyrphobacter sp.]